MEKYKHDNDNAPVESTLWPEINVQIWQARIDSAIENIEKAKVTADEARNATTGLAQATARVDLILLLEGALIALSHSGTSR